MVAFRQSHHLVLSAARGAALALALASAFALPSLARALQISSDSHGALAARDGLTAPTHRHSRRRRCGRKTRHHHSHRRPRRRERPSCRGSDRRRLVKDRIAAGSKRGTAHPKTTTIPSTTATTAEATTSPTTSGQPPGALSPSWNGDFSTGDFSQYDGSPTYHPDGNPADYAIVGSPVPAGFTHAFQATLEAGAGSVVAGQAGERTLLTLWPSSDDGVDGKTRAYQGADTWYRDEVYFPSTFIPSQDSAWNWVYELHNYPDSPCCANLALSVVSDRSDGGPSGGERLSVRIMGGGSEANPIDSGQDSAYGNPDAVVRWIQGPEIHTGHWYDLVWHVHWDWRPASRGGEGQVQYWIDGTLIGSYSGPTLFYYGALHGPGQAYLQEGYYRPDDLTAGYAQPTASVYHAGTMIGPSAASIGEGAL